MNLKISHCFLVVDDLEKALGFYRDALGLQVRNDVMFGDMRWLSLAAPAQPDVEIVLELPSNHPQISEADKASMADLMAKGLLKGLIFITDSCDKTYERLLGAGAEATQEPTNQPYGVRDCAFRDPAGNMIRFSEVLAS